jgi:hypothetical protein
LKKGLGNFSLDSVVNSVSNLKCCINRSVPFKYFDRLSLFNRFNRDPVFDYSIRSHSLIVYESDTSSNNPRPEPVSKTCRDEGANS